MEIFAIGFVEGIVLGSIYAVVALGFVLIFKTSKILNFAQGELMMVGAYIVYSFVVQLRVNFLFSFLFTFLITAFLGIIIHFSLFKKLIGKPPFTLVMITIALSYLLKSGVQLIWGAEDKAIPAFLPGSHVKIMNVPITRDSIAVVFFALIFMVLFHIFFKKNKIGIAMRATAVDQVAATGCGIDVNVIFAMSWAISFILSSVSGVVMARAYSLNSNLGIVGIKVFPVIILGGLDSIGGAILGGYIIGLLECLSRAYIGQYFSTSLDIISFIVLIFILLMKSYGLFGTKRVERL